MNGKLFDKKISDTANLIASYLNGDISLDDKKKLSDWLSESKENEKLLNSLREDLDSNANSEFFSSLNIDQSLEEIKVLTGQKRKSILNRYAKALKVACFIILISTGVGFFINIQKSDKLPPVSSRVIQVKTFPLIKAGGDRAKLELANGSTMALEELTSSVIHDKGALISRKEGVIYYTINEAKATNQLNYNRITTPKGGKYEIVLPDGTHVWLNSESSLRFPITLSPVERIVELTGEAYFEVTKMPHKPFKVRVKDVTVEALGTSFNITSYRNESSVKTTLVEGSIKVSKGQQSKLVRPGQQIEAKEILEIVENSNIQKAIAWKADLFEFENDELNSVFPQLERWYDVEINYSDDISIKRFTGTISRTTEIMVVLEMLKEAGINYQIEGRRVFLY